MTCEESFAALGVRNAHAMFYDAASERMTIVGGADHAQVCGDSWAWAESRWEPLGVNGPSPRTFAAVAHDPATGAVFLFGGNSVLFGPRTFSGKPKLDSTLSDLWRWDGAEWEEIRPTGPSPSARSEAAVAFDSKRGNLLLFGGYTVEDGETGVLGDTWEWDGRSWTEMLPSRRPPAQSGASMAYDESRSVLVLVGRSGDKSTGETWEWTGSSWKHVSTASRPPRYNAAVAYDPVAGQIVLFGGWTGSERAGDTWAYDGSTWKVISDEGPDARNHAALAFDRSSGRLLLFGGHEGESVFGDLWALDSGRWSALLHRPSAERVDNDH